MICIIGYLVACMRAGMILLIHVGYHQGTAHGIPVGFRFFFLFFQFISNPFLVRFQLVSKGASPSSRDDVFFLPTSSLCLPRHKDNCYSNNSKYDDESVMKVQQVAAAAMTLVPRLCGHDDAYNSSILLLYCAAYIRSTYNPGTCGTLQYTYYLNTFEFFSPQLERRRRNTPYLELFTRIPTTCGGGLMYARAYYRLIPRDFLVETH